MLANFLILQELMGGDARIFVEVHPSPVSPPPRATTRENSKLMVFFRFHWVDIFGNFYQNRKITHKADSKFKHSLYWKNQSQRFLRECLKVPSHLESA